MPPDYLITSSLKIFKTTGTLDGPDVCKVERIVRAKNEAAALKHVVADTITIARATLDDAIRVGKIEAAE